MTWKTWENGQHYNYEEFKRLNDNYKELAALLLIYYRKNIAINTMIFDGYKTIAWQEFIQQMQTDLVKLNVFSWGIVDKPINYLNADNINYWESKGKHIEDSIQAFLQSAKYCGAAVSGVDYLWQL